MLKREMKQLTEYMRKTDIVSERSKHVQRFSWFLVYTADDKCSQGMMDMLRTRVVYVSSNETHMYVTE